MSDVKKTNPWLLHVAKFRSEHPELAYKDVLAQAKSSYAPVKKSEGSGVRLAGSGVRLAGGSKPKKERKPKKEKVQNAGALRLAGEGCGCDLEGAGIIGDTAEKIYLAKMKKMGVLGMENRYPGELHSPLKMPDGSLRVGNFIGPGTQILKRLQRGDIGLTGVDMLAMRHDSLYSLAKTKKDIRKADEDFLKILKSGVVKDHPFNLKAGNLGISSKYAAETISGVKFPSAKELKANNPNDPLLLKVIADTDVMFGVAPTRSTRSESSGKGLKLAGEGQSGEGILDKLQKMIDWIFGSNKTAGKKSSEAKQPEPVKETCKQILEKYGIVDKKSFRRWALRNHPDKQEKDLKTQAEASELFAQIKNCMEERQIGDGFSLANFKKAADKYSKISKSLGVKPEDALNVIKAKAKEKGLSFGSGQSGSGFWDFLSVLSVLPIPFISDVARTISLVATPIRVATGTFTPALDGMVTDTMKEIASIFPKELQDTLFKPASAFAESVGFGLTFGQAGSGGVTPMQKVQALYAMVKKIDDAKDKILKLEPKTRDKMINMRKKTKDVADYIMGKLGATAVSMPDPYADLGGSAYSRAH